MSTANDDLKLSILVRQATPEQQRSLLKWLLAKFVAEKGPEPEALSGDNGVPLGIFIPNADYQNKSPMSEAQYAELLETVRNTTEDQLLTFEQMIRELGLEDVRQMSKR